MRTDLSLSGMNTLIGTPHYLAPRPSSSRTASTGAPTSTRWVPPPTSCSPAPACSRRATWWSSAAAIFIRSPPAPRAKRQDVPEALDRLVLACLEKNRDDRPPHAGAVADRLRSCGIAEWTRPTARTWWDGAAENAGLVHPHAPTITVERSDTFRSTTLAFGLDRRS